MAFERLQRAWSSARTLHRDARYFSVDKPAGVPVRRAEGEGETPPDLCERLAQHGVSSLQPVLSVPERASGVTLLAFEAQGQSGIRSSPVERLSVVLGVDDVRGADTGQLPSESGSGVSPLEYRVLRRQAGRALVRVVTRGDAEGVARAFARAGQPIVGDAGAPAATRLLLHVERLEGRGLDIVAPLPIEFESWLRGAPQRPPSELSLALEEGALVRSSLWPEQDAYRLVGEDAGEISGLTVDRYGEHAVLEISSEAAWLERDRSAECLMDHGARGVYVKRRVRADLRKHDTGELAPPLPLRGEPAPDPTRVRHGPVHFWVRLGDGLATGLYLDQRENWQRVRRGAQGASLLNLFSYTGAFSVAAAAGGASATVSVDLSKRALARLGLNLELNHLSGPQHRLLASDVLRWLGRAGRSAQRFDWVVLDPPSFGTRRGGVLRAERDYAGLVAAALGLLQPGGRLLCVSHQLGFSHADLSQLVRSALEASRVAGSVESWVGGWDAPTLPGVSGTKSVLARLR